jgi:hypothetical protein
MDARLQAALDEIELAAAPLDLEALLRQVPGKWSIAGIFEHLTLAFTANAGTLEKVLASGELRARTPGLSQRVARVLVNNLGYFPRVEAPERTRPVGTIAPERSVAELRDALTALDAALTRVAARFGENIPVANHPYLAGLTVNQWRTFHWRHTMHHMRQVRRRTAA